MHLHLPLAIYHPGIPEGPSYVCAGSCWVIRDPTPGIEKKRTPDSIRISPPRSRAASRPQGISVPKARKRLLKEIFGIAHDPSESANVYNKLTQAKAPLQNPPIRTVPATKLKSLAGGTPPVSNYSLDVKPGHAEWPFGFN